MKNLNWTVWWIFLISCSGAAHAESATNVSAPAFEQGKHYVLVSPPQPTSNSAKIEVLEAFSYACPHCNDFEPIVGEWASKRPADVEFRRLPVVFRDSWAPLAKMYYTAEIMGNLDKVGPALFRALHTEKRKLYDEASLRDFVGELGGDKNEFSRTFNSFAVDGKVRQAVQAVGKLGISGVPTIIVNGKYQTSASLAGDFAAMMKVVDYLVAKERGGAAK